MSAPLFREIFLDPIHDSRSSGMRIGNVIFLPFIEARPDETIAVEERTRIQIAEVLTTMDNVLLIAETDRSVVARVTFFMREVRERPILNEVWKSWFPDPLDRPPHKYVPALLPEGVNVAIQVLASVGGKREVLEIPGLEHGDPMSMGARTANIVTSSRLFGLLEDLDDEITLVLERIGILMKQAGATLDQITQATFFVGTPEIGAVLQQRWDAHWSTHVHRPHIHMIVTDLGWGSGFPRIEILGLIE